MAIRPQIKQLGTNSTIYGLGNLLNKLAAFLLIPVYTKYLATSDVGIFALIEMAEKLLITLAPLGIIRAMWRFFPDKNYDLKQVFSSAYSGIMIINIAAMLILGLFYKKIGPLLGMGDDQVLMVLVILLNILLALGTNFLLSIWQYDQKAANYMILTVSQFLGILILSTVFVIFLDMGLWGLLLGKTFVLAVSFIFSIVLITIHYYSAPSLGLLMKLLKYGSPFIFLALVAPILTLSSRFFLRIFMSLEDIAIYFIGFKFGMLLNMFLVVPIQRGLIPLMYKMGIDDKSKAIYPDMLFYYTVIGSIFYLAVSLLIKPVLGIVTRPEYLAGAGLIPIVAFAYFLAGFQHFFTASAALKNKTGRIATASVLTIVTNLVLNYFLIRQYGILGAAWATLLSYFVLSVYIYFISYRIEQFNWRLVRVAVVVAVTIIIYFSANYFNELYNAINLVISLLSIVVFVIFLKISGILGHREINGLKSIIKKFRVK